MNSMSESDRQLLQSLSEMITLAMDRFRAARQKIRSEEEAAQERYRSNLLRAISHDLRTPLSAIMGTSEMILGMSENDDPRRALAWDIYQDADWLHSLVENILSLTRIQDGHLNLHLEKEAAEEIIASALDHIAKRAPQRMINVSIPDEVLMIPMDGKLIQQVLINLLDNALKHTQPQDEITLTLRRDQNEAVFTVRDGGEGIADKDLAHIFQTFYTTRTRQADAQHGIGLGLTICESIVKAHHGTISARNRTDWLRRGIYIPAAFGGITMNKFTTRILIVEDDPQIRNFISYVLSAEGFASDNAATAQSAMTLLAANVYDLMLLDLGLPDYDGMDVIRKVREWSEIPILVVSARDQDQEKAQALDLGADDYLTKPFSTTELMARIRVAIRHAFRQNTVAVQKVLTVRELSLDLEKRQVTLRGQPLHLTPMEYNLLSLFLRNSGKVLTTRYLISSIWGSGYGEDTQALRALMAGLRRKIEENPAKPRYIVTEIGVGYRLVDQDMQKG